MYLLCRQAMRNRTKATDTKLIKIKAECEMFSRAPPTFFLKKSKVLAPHRLKSFFFNFIDAFGTVLV